MEREIDEANAKAIEAMDKTHLNKTKTKQVEAAIKRWSKDSASNIKKIKNINIHSLNAKRGWYHA